MEFLLVQNVINRMKKASESNRGIRISAAELAEMKLTIFGEIWEQNDPSHLTSRQSRAAKRGAFDKFDQQFKDGEPKPFLFT